MNYYLCAPALYMAVDGKMHSIKMTICSESDLEITGQITKLYEKSEQSKAYEKELIGRIELLSDYAFKYCNQKKKTGPLVRINLIRAEYGLKEIPITGKVIQ